MTRKFFPLALLALAAASSAQNLVQNPGFESGSLAGWGATNTSATSAAVHSGSYAAVLNVSTPTRTTNYAGLGQSLSTAPGTYRVSFWLRRFSLGTSSFTARFASKTILALSSKFGSFDYRLYSFDVTATEASSALSFSANGLNTLYRVDDVSVVPVTAPVPEPSTLAALGLGGFVFLRRRARF